MEAKHTPGPWKETGGPAFPTSPDNSANPKEGMTLRDYFAAKALSAIVPEYSAGQADQVAKEAYMFADAMLRAREAA